MIADPARGIALLEELHTAVGLAQLGLGALQGIDGANNFYHLPLQLLASSKERLLKIMLSVDLKQKSGNYRDLRTMKNFGHDVEKLIAEVTKPEVWGDEWLTAKAGAADQMFLSSNPTYTQVVGILSHFGRFGRYSNLDIVAGVSVEHAPEDSWQSLELAMLTGPEIAELGTGGGAEIARSAINQRIIIILERSFRALCRWFTLGGGAGLGRQYSGVILPFLRLRDSDLGRRQWIRVGA